MFGYCAPSDGATAAAATPARVGRITICDTTFETIGRMLHADDGENIYQTIDPATHVAVLLKILDRCGVPAEQRARVQFGGGDIPAALVGIDVGFSTKQGPNPSILGPLTAYPALARSLQVVEFDYNDYDESAALDAFAAVATHLRELTFRWCGLTSLRGLEGRCEHLRKVVLFGCKDLNSIHALGDRVYLEEVSATGTGISSIEPLRSCPNLTKVALRRCQQLSSIDALENHQRLQVVDVSGTPITSIEPLRSCRVLATVYIVGCQQLTADVGLPASVKIMQQY